jgi:hypothetical protein
VARHKRVPAPGAAKPGRTYTPASDNTDAEAPVERPRAAPAPGVPISPDEYERLKDKATRRRSKSDDVPAQDDPAHR